MIPGLKMLKKGKFQLAYRENTFLVTENDFPPFPKRRSSR